MKVWPFVLALSFAAPAVAATSGANGTHDPSRMIASNGKFYVYSTGGGSKSSTDGLAWTNGPAIFTSGIPQSATSVVSNNEGVWAPDVVYLNGQYFLYYAVANAQNDCAVGLVTSPTLDPSAPNYKWTDRGVVVSNTNTTYCAIDPCPVLDASGNLWLSWGSGYSKATSDQTIYVTRLDNTTGLVSSADSAKPGHPLQPGHIEASYIYLHGGKYFLFWNSGGCCSGASSTYTIHVASASDITGPYSGSRIFYQSNGSIHGPGQIGIYDKCGASRFTYHYYPDTGGSVLGENELTWGSDGWPVAGAPSTTPLTACADPGAGGASGSGTGGSSGGTSGGAGATGGGSDDAGLPPQTGGTSGLGTGGAGEGGRVGGTGGAFGDTGGGAGGSREGFGGSGPGSGGATGGSGPATGGVGGPAATGDSGGCSCALEAGTVVQDVAQTICLISVLCFLAVQLRPRRRRRR